MERTTERGWQGIANQGNGRFCDPWCIGYCSGAAGWRGTSSAGQKRRGLRHSGCDNRQRTYKRWLHQLCGNRQLYRRQKRRAAPGRDFRRQGQGHHATIPGRFSQHDEPWKGISGCFKRKISRHRGCQREPVWRSYNWKRLHSQREPAGST